ncbi:hypothetical protein VB711_14565 [Cronbergia sp. UHCC 0137]|uniref:hypothetical protein n=1 Tax=Cronbergia sp. UHCC 0137 TaxID=3110239 RepID=UPI002B1FB561|nr:hypothetical protein [Cronbergia sp. UHCC 0137]MEA5619051.1 hypothetical protein [Cronbergia sp. UHCC 0137]
MVEIDVQRLAKMPSPAGVGMQHEPIRLCSACYAETAIAIICVYFPSLPSVKLSLKSLPYGN